MGIELTQLGNYQFRFEPCATDYECTATEPDQDGKENEMKLDAFENAIRTLNQKVAKLEEELELERALAEKLIRQLAEHKTQAAQLAIEDYKQRRLIRPKGLPQ